jgi:hypothetical protein
LNDGRIPTPDVVRVAPGTGYNRVKGNRRASRNGPVSDLPQMVTVGLLSGRSQVHKDFEYMGVAANLATLTLYGGTPYDPQTNALRRGVDVVVGTPGRIKDHLERGTLDMSNLKYAPLPSCRMQKRNHLVARMRENEGEAPGLETKRGYQTDAHTSAPCRSLAMGGVWAGWHIMFTHPGATSYREIAPLTYLLTGRCMCRYRILDEADEMLNMGFVDDVEKILSSANNVQTLLFSATLPSWVKQVRMVHRLRHHAGSLTQTMEPTPANCR